MTRKELRLKIKEEQKQLAIDIKRGKFLTSPKNWEVMTDVERKTYLFKTTGSYGISHGFLYKGHSRISFIPPQYTQVADWFFFLVFIIRI